LNGQKKIESRWYSTRRAPWDKIKAGETIYFKDSGESVKIKAKVIRVLQFADLTPKKAKEILDKYGGDDGIAKEKIFEFFARFKNKRYCLLIFLKNPTKTKPFHIDKTGFGAMSAWITVKNINEIKKNNLCNLTKIN